MSITPMYEIFILLEDEKQVPLYRINRWGRQARGVLARLKKLGWVKKLVQDNEIYYSITPRGEKAIDEYLKPLKSMGKWDGRWRLVIFDVPESKRGLRDRLRRELTKLGLGRLQASVWISPNDIEKDIEKLSEKFNLQGEIKFFEVSQNSNLDKTIIEKSWNLPDLYDDYKKFNFQSSRILSSIDSDPNQRFTAKKLIFEYALILQKDPILPWEYRQKDELRKTAHELYLRLRTFII